jgi:hypothetical protein
VLIAVIPFAETNWFEFLAGTDTVPAETGRSWMQDVLMLLYTVIFFAVAFLYVKACQKLR